MLLADTTASIASANLRAALSREPRGNFLMVLSPEGGILKGTEFDSERKAAPALSDKDCIFGDVAGG
jgi:hypothetical protein